MPCWINPWTKDLHISMAISMCGPFFLQHINFERLFILFINYNTITNYILIIYELSNLTRNKLDLFSGITAPRTLAQSCIESFTNFRLVETA